MKKNKNLRIIFVFVEDGINQEYLNISYHTLLKNTDLFERK